MSNSSRKTMFLTAFELNNEEEEIKLNNEKEENLEKPQEKDLPL